MGWVNKESSIVKKYSNGGDVKKTSKPTAAIKYQHALRNPGKYTKKELNELRLAKEVEKWPNAEFTQYINPDGSLKKSEDIEKYKEGNKVDAYKALREKYGHNKVNLYLARINSKDPKINAAASEIFNNPKIDAEIKKAMPKKEKKKEVKKYKPGGKTKRQKADELIYESGETYSGKKLRKILGIPSKKSIKDYKKKHRK